MNPGKSKNTTQPGNTLSSIVSGLVRAAIGGNHQDVPDGDLDKYVADMIMKSATEADKRYKSVGLKAYTGASSHINDENKVELAPGIVVDRADSNGLKTNKRFLTSLIRSTDEHNQALIRSEERRAADIAKELIADLDRRGYGRRHRDEDSALSPSRGRSQKRSRSRSISSSFSRSESRSRSASRSISRSPERNKGSARIVVRGRGSKKYEAQDGESSLASSGSRLGSKMDKYFQEGYDPRLDTHSESEGLPITKERKKKKKDKKSRSRRKEDKERSSRHRRHGDDKESERERRKSHRTDRDDGEDYSRSSSSRKSKRRRRHESGSDSDADGSDNSGRHHSSRSHKRKSSRKEDREHISRRRYDNDDSSSDHDLDSKYRSSPRDRETERRRRRDRVTRSRSPSPARSKSPTRTIPAKPATREWDLHKVNKAAIQEQLLDRQRSRK